MRTCPVRVADDRERLRMHNRSCWSRLFSFADSLIAGSRLARFGHLSSFHKTSASRRLSEMHILYLSLSLCWHNAHTQEAWPNVDVERDAAAVIDLKKSSFISKSKERCSQMIHSGVFLRNWSSNTVLFTMWLDRIIYIIYAICVYCYCIPIKIKIYKSWPGHFYIHRKKSKLLINFKSFHIYTQKNHCQLLYISRVTVAKRTFWPLASSVWWRRLETFCSARWRTCNSWTVAQSLPSAHPAVFGPVNEKRRRQWAQRQRSTGGFFLLQFTYLSVW